MRTVRLLFGVCLIALVSMNMANAESLYVDTFQSNTPGASPGAPEIGSRSFGGTGTHVVVDMGGGDLRLRSTDNSTSNGLLIEFFPTSAPEIGSVSYDFRIDSGDIGFSLNPFAQELVFNPGGTNVDLYWSGFDHFLYLRQSVDGVSSAPVKTTFTWAFDTDYHVLWGFNGAFDTFSLAVNGTSIVSGASFGGNINRFVELASVSNFPILGSQVIDNVRINASPVPEPGTLILLSSGILGLVGVVKKRRAA